MRRKAELKSKFHIDQMSCIGHEAMKCNATMLRLWCMEWLCSRFMFNVMVLGYGYEVMNVWYEMVNVMSPCLTRIRPFQKSCRSRP